MLPLLPLAPLLISVLPDLGRHLFGRTGETVARGAADVVREVIGTDDPATVEEALKDPAKVDELRIRLAEIAANAEAAARKAELDELAAIMADRADARQMAQGGSLAFGAKLVTVASFILFTGVLALLALVDIPSGNRETLFMLAGTIASMVGAATQFWVGSSAGSAGKSGLLGGPLDRSRRT